MAVINSSVSAWDKIDDVMLDKGYTKARESLEFGAETPTSVQHKAYRIDPGLSNITGQVNNCLEHEDTMNVVVAFLVAQDAGESSTIRDVLTAKDDLVDALLGIDETLPADATYQRLHNGRYLQLTLAVSIQFSRQRVAA